MSALHTNAHQECALRRLATGASTEQIKFQTRMALVRRALIEPGIGIAALTATGRVEALRSLREIKACHNEHGLTFPGNDRAITELEGLLAA
jgi:hypothetical protein